MKLIYKVYNDFQLGMMAGIFMGAAILIPLLSYHPAKWLATGVCGFFSLVIMFIAAWHQASGEEKNNKHSMTGG